MKFRNLIQSFFFFCLTSLAFAGSTTISASQDVYVRQGHSTNQNDGNILVKNQNNYSSSFIRKGIIQFEFQKLPYIDDAQLILDVSTTGGSSSQTIYVWGLKDRHSLEDFDETTTTIDDWGQVFDSSGDGVTNWLSVFYDPDPNTPGAQPLGTLTVLNSDLNNTVIFEDENLRNYLASDTNGVATILLTRKTASSAVTGFAAFEHETLNEPRLFISAPDQTITTNADTYVRKGHSQSYGNTTQIYVKKAGTSNNNRMGVMTFDLSEIEVAKNTELLLDVTHISNGSGGTFYVFAAKDLSLHDTINAEGTSYYDYGPMVDTSSDSVTNHSAYFYNDGDALGTFSIDTSDVGQTVRFTSNLLTDLINDDTNNRVTLFLTRTTSGGGSLNTNFASKEHTTLEGPRLVVRPDIEKYTVTVDFEVLLADVDGESDDEMILVINTPDGGGYTTADPWVMADFFHTSGYGLGQDNDFYEALSATQQATFQLQYGNATTTLDLCLEEHTNQAVASHAIEEFFDSIENERQYNLDTFASRYNLEAGIGNGGFDFSASTEPCTLLEIQDGAFFSTVETSSSQAALTLQKGEFSIGAESNSYTATVGLQSNSGSYASISYSAGGGVFVQVLASPDGVGASFPFFFNTTFSFYVTAEDALTMEQALRDNLSDDLYDGLVDAHVSLLSQQDRSRRLSIYLETTNDTMTILVRESGAMTMAIVDNVDQLSINDGIDAIEEVSNDTSGQNGAVLFDGTISSWQDLVSVFSNNGFLAIAVEALVEGIGGLFEAILGG